MGLLDAISRLLVGKREREQTQTVQEQKPKPRRKTARNAEHVSLAEWKKELYWLESHPLTQAKIINERLLESVYSVLEQISSKVDALDKRLEKITQGQEALRTSLSKVEALQADFSVKRVKLKAAVKELESNLTKQELKMLELIKKGKASQAGELANTLNISRSNASLKLNKLFDMGLLDKEKQGKDTFYQIK